MATYIKGVTDYIPVLEPFKPDYKFLSDVLTVRQDRYDTNYKTLNNLYSKVVHAPLSREDNQQVREQYANRLSNGLKQVTGIDLSLQQNVDIAKGLFKPFFDDKRVVKDMAFTKLYGKEMQTVNSYMTSPSDKDRDRYWQVGVQDLKYQMQDYKDAEADAAAAMPMPSYVENPNIYERSFEALKDSELSIKQTTLEGDWIITTKNGTALTRQVAGYKMTKDGKDFEYDEFNQPIPIYRNPAAEYLKNTVMKDPIVLRGLLTEAKVKSREFWENEENIQIYGSIDNAKKAWADQQIQTQSTADIKELVEKEAEVKKESRAARNWEQYKKQHNIIPGTPEEELWLLSQFNKRLALSNRDSIKSRVMEQKAPTSDLNGLMNKAYSAYMASVMGPKMSAAATAYSQVDAEQTFVANPFKKMEHAHRYDLNRMAIQYQYDVSKIGMRSQAALNLAKYKASLENTGGGGGGLLGGRGVLTEQGGSDISGSLASTDADSEVDVNIFEENLEGLVDINKVLTGEEILFIEKLIEKVPNDMLGVAGIESGGQITYSYFDENTNQTTTRTESMSKAWKDLNDGNATNRTEFDRILKNVTSAYTNIVKTEDGTELHYDLAKLNVNPLDASTIHELYNSVIKGRERLNIKVEEMNKVYHTAHDYTQTKDAEMENSSEYKNQPFSIPPVLLTQGEINMLNTGVPWYQVKTASENGKLEEPVKDGSGSPVRRFVNEDEYATIFANMNQLMDHQRSSMNSGSGDEDDYIFLVSQNQFWNDRETLAQRYWNHDGGEYVMYGVDGGVKQTEGTGWQFNREKALEEGKEHYQNWEENMNAIMSSGTAADMGLVYNLRGQMIGQEEQGIGEAGYTIYNTTYDAASPSNVARNQLLSIIDAFQKVPRQDIDYTWSLGNNMTMTTEDIADDGEYLATSKAIFKTTVEDFNTGKLDKTDARPYISTSYVEKSGGPDQENDIAAYNIRFGSEYANNYKDLFIKNNGELDKKAFAKFKREGITVTIPTNYDNNPYKSTNQLLSYTDLTIKDNGYYESVPIVNGGSFKIYKNSNGQYIQQNSTFLFNNKTGGTPPNEVTSFVLDVDPQQLDNLVVNMDQYLLGLAKENNNKHDAWTLKNSKKVAK
jgi:hypothetical protein